MLPSQNVAVIGLGSMGYGIALSALRVKHRVWGYDINPGQIEKFRADGGQTGALSDIASDLSIAALVVLNAAQTEDVLFGADALAPQLTRGTVVISCATVLPQFARDLETRCTEYGVLYLDAPISGGAAKAASGELTIMASGIDAAFAASRPLLDVIAAKVFELGDSAGPGSAMKATNQLLDGVHIAASADFEAPITVTALGQYRQAVEMGLGGVDDAAVAKVYARQAGLTLPRDEAA